MRNPTLREQIAGALAWWREAGVDCDFSDQPAVLAGESARTRGRAGKCASLRSGASRTSARRALPASLADFTAWWLADPSLDPWRSEGRIAPRCKPGAKVMVLVASPESEDRERLLSGPQGRLLEAMLGALGWAEEAYVASVLPRDDPMPDWPAVAAAGLGDDRPAPRLAGRAGAASGARLQRLIAARARRGA